MNQIYYTPLLLFSLFISIQTKAQKAIPPITQETGKQIYNSMSGSSWVVKMKNNSTKNITENWMKELNGTDRVTTGTGSSSSYGGYSFKILDLSNCNIEGDMPEFCFSQDWNNAKNIVPSAKHKYWDNSQARRTSEDNDQFVSAHISAQLPYLNFSYNNITSISRDITMFMTTVPSMNFSHNEITELPDFIFCKGYGTGGIWQKRGGKIIDFSQNKISKIEVNHLIDKMDQGPGKDRSGLFTLSGQQIDFSNNLLNFTELKKLDQFISDQVRTEDYIVENYVYSPQKPLGIKIEDTYAEGESVSLTFNGSKYTPHQDNSYVWYLNGKKTGYVGQTITIPSLGKEEAGVYVCKISNPAFPDLVLESEPMCIWLEKVNKTAPTNVKISSNNAPGKVGAFGYTIGNLSAQDSEEVFFMLKGIDNDYCFRIINGNTLVNAEVLFDHWSMQTFDVNVIAYDVYGGTTEKVIKISRDEKAESALDDMYQKTLQNIYDTKNERHALVIPNLTPVDENKYDTKIGSVKMKMYYDKKYGNKYKPESKDISNVTFHLKDIYDNSNFEIRFGELYIKKGANYEVKNSYKVQVSGTYTSNGNSIVFDQIFIVQINDVLEAPKEIILTKNTMNINEPVGTTVGFLSIVNEDQNPSPCTLISNNKKFRIEGTTLKTDVKFKKTGTENLTITATNALGLSYNKAFTINFIDPNKNTAPTAIYLNNMTIPSGISPDSFLSDILTVDTDDNETFTYTVDNPLFEVKADKLFYKNGSLSNKNTINITAHDKAGNTYTQTFNLYKDVTTASETVPTIIGLTSTKCDNLVVGNVVGQIVSDYPATYSINHENFEVDGNNLKIKKELTANNYTIELTATNGAGDYSQSLNIYKISSDGNTIIPFEKIALTNNIVSSDWANGAEVAEIIHDGNESVIFELASEEDFEYFTIEGNILKVIKTLTEKDVYSIKIIAKGTNTEAFYFDLYVPIIVNGIENIELTSKGFVYPNPTNDIINIKTGESVDVYNSTGVLVKQENIVSNQINIGDLSSGLYILKITDGQVFYTVRIIKN